MKKKKAIAYGLFLFAMVFLFSACAKNNSTAELRETENLLAEEKTQSDQASDYAGKLRISELLVKNHATVMDAKGQFPDYIELENISDETLQLKGFGLADGENEEIWTFPDCSLAAGERLLLFAGGKNGGDDPLRCSFSLSLGEQLLLYDPQERVIDRADCSSATADVVLCLDEQGQWIKTEYPSPGFSNDWPGYVAWQESQHCGAPLQINEVMTSNDRYLPQLYLGFCDWIEVKNCSEQPVQLAEYWLSDDEDQLAKWQFPSMVLEPGRCITILCDDGEKAANPGQLKANFKLSSEREQVFLSQGNGAVMDFVFLRDIPYNCSYGRRSGENGWFFFDQPSPGEENVGGYRRISQTPEATQPDGIFNGAVDVVLQGMGTIFYTMDGSEPGSESFLYTGSIRIENTCVLRAVCIEEAAMPSRPLTLSYIIGENHSLPVLSLATDDIDAFQRMYNGKRKDMLVSGSLSFFEEGGSFTVPCGIEMHGDASLEMRKKNMSVKFSGAFGKKTLSYDVYGGGVTEFSDFVLRSGQDYVSSIVRNELLENLCLQYSDSVPSQRSRHCVLYINGEYSGLYTLMEKLNEEHYARLYQVDPDTVTVIKARAPLQSAFYMDVIQFAQENDLTRTEDYERFCTIVDIDSLIDWMIIEGYSVNTDISNGNLRYCRSSEGDGKWRFMLYDMDSTMGTPTNAFHNVLMPNSTQCAVFIQPLMQNEQFRERFLSRAAQVLQSTLSDENVVAELDRLAALIDPEVERDYARFGMEKRNWEGSVKSLRSSILERGWSARCVDALCRFFRLDETEKKAYFGA